MSKKGSNDILISKNQAKGIKRNEQTKQINIDCMKTQRFEKHVYKNDHDSLYAWRLGMNLIWRESPLRQLPTQPTVNQSKFSR